MKVAAFIGLAVLVIASLSFRSLQRAEKQDKYYKTERVIVVVVDGPRYSETWGDSLRRYIPYMATEMAAQGAVFTNFFNTGFTYTTSGHAAICTGYRQQLENMKGSQLPAYPSFLQYYLSKYKLPSSKAWVITSKDKLQILADCEEATFKNKFNPQTSCGIKGLGSGHCADSITGRRVLEVLKKEQPNMLLVNLMEPDIAGHQNKWNEYLRSIQQSDSMVYSWWKFIQEDPYYKGRTTFIVTNDHGRHLDDWKDGFVSHGDTCLGCRHINLYAYGPDFNKGLVIDEAYAQEDISATIATLMGFHMKYTEGKVIRPLLKPLHSKGTFELGR